MYPFNKKQRDEPIDKKQAMEDLKFMAEQLQIANAAINEAYQRISDINEGLYDGE